MVKKVISGGQTGADRTGLECARELGIPTGGYAPRGYKTENGSDPSLKEFGVVETVTNDYKPRTRLNVQHSDVTFWFGRVGSPGYICTVNACNDLDKKLIQNPTSLLRYVDLYEVWNIAGNRKSKNPDVVRLVREAFNTLIPLFNGDSKCLNTD